MERQAEKEDSERRMQLKERGSDNDTSPKGQKKKGGGNWKGKKEIKGGKGAKGGARR